MTNDILDRAIVFAVNAHAGQRRKDGAPFILHPLEDAAIVGTLTDDPEIIAAAVLHDTVEDTAVTGDEILGAFGARVYELVMHETEEKRPAFPPHETWRIRKEESLDALSRTKDIAVKMLWLGDKLSNMRALSRDLDALGEDVFKRFHNRDPLAHKWYYTTVLELIPELSDTPAYAEYAALTHRVFDRYQ